MDFIYMDSCNCESKQSFYSMMMGAPCSHFRIASHQLAPPLQHIHTSLHHTDTHTPPPLPGHQPPRRANADDSRQEGEPTHSFIYSLSQSVTHSLTQSLTHSFIYPITDSLTLTQSLTHSLTHSLTRSLHPLTHLLAP